MSWNWRDGGGVDVTRPGSQLIILAPFSTKVEKRNENITKKHSMQVSIIQKCLNTRKIGPNVRNYI